MRINSTAKKMVAILGVSLPIALLYSPVANDQLGSAPNYPPVAIIDEIACPLIVGPNL